MPRVILASGSPRRRELLAALVPEFEVIVSNVNEPPVGDDPVAGAIRLAASKALAVAGLHPGAVVVGADTVVHDGVREYAKPASAEGAEAMLRDLRGRPHQVVTGVAVVYNSSLSTAASVSTVTLAAMDNATIAAYVASGRPLDKAGAYAIQDEDIPTVTHLDGCYCGVMGLPLWTLRGLLRDAGLDGHDPSRGYARCARCPERRQ